VCDYRRGLGWRMHLSTTYIHNLELQAITALTLISTLYKSLHVKYFLDCCVSNSHYLATASKTGDSSASCVQVVTVWRISYNCTHSACLASSLCSLGADPPENTTSNSFSIVVTGGCLAIARILLTCSPDATKQ
jgi:hypothetical protein